MEESGGKDYDEEKSIFWMNLVLVFALIVGLALPAANVSAASKKKRKQRKQRKYWLSIFPQREQRRVPQKK